MRQEVETRAERLEIQIVGGIAVLLIVLVAIGMATLIYTVIALWLLGGV